MVSETDIGDLLKITNKTEDKDEIIAIMFEDEAMTVINNENDRKLALSNWNIEPSESSAIYTYKNRGRVYLTVIIENDNKAYGLNSFNNETGEYHTVYKISSISNRTNKQSDNKQRNFQESEIGSKITPQQIVAVTLQEGTTLSDIEDSMKSLNQHAISLTDKNERTTEGFNRD